jgi:hypothetical protein
VQGALSWLAVCRLAGAVRDKFGASAATWFLVISASQFHAPFYMSRTLPNTAAFIPVVFATAHWLDGTHLWVVPMLLAATTVIFRCDTLLVGGAICAHMLVTSRMTLRKLVALSLGAVAAAGAVTVLADSVFWGRWLWPEAEVFWFNAVLGRCARRAVSHASMFVVICSHAILARACCRATCTTIMPALIDAAQPHALVYCSTGGREAAPDCPAVVQILQIHPLFFGNVLA